MYKRQSKTTSEVVNGKVSSDIAGVYQSAFAQPPYNEIFTLEEATINLSKLINNGGDLLIRRLGTVSYTHLCSPRPKQSLLDVWLVFSS